MKPVPIMQYLDHFGRVAHGTTSSPPIATPAPCALQAAHPASGAATPRRAPRWLSGRALREAGARAQRSGCPPRPRPAPSEAEIEARVAEAYHRGRARGRAAARAEDAEALARERRASASGRWRSGSISSSTNTRGSPTRSRPGCRRSSSVSPPRQRACFRRCCSPRRSKTDRRRLVRRSGQAASRRTPGLIRIRGPERVLAALRERVACMSVDVEYVADEGVEVTIVRRTRRYPPRCSRGRN